MALSWSQCHYEYRFQDARLASKVSLQEPAVWVQHCPIQKVPLLPILFLTSLFAARGAARMRVCLQAMKCSVSQVWGEIIFTIIGINVAIWSVTDLSLSLRAQTKFLVSTCHTMVTHWKDCFIWRWWFSVVCTLVGNDYRHHSGQNVADSRGAATADFLLLFHPRNTKGNVLALSFWVYWHLLQHKASHVFEEANQKANK